MNEAGQAQPNVPMSDDELVEACENFMLEQQQLPQDLVEELHDHELWITPKIVADILAATAEE